MDDDIPAIIGFLRPPKYAISKRRWRAMYEFLKRTTTLSDDLDEAMTALIEGKTKVEESRSIQYVNAKAVGIRIDFAELRSYLVPSAEWATARTLLKDANKLPPALDRCLTALIKRDAEMIMSSEDALLKSFDERLREQGLGKWKDLSPAERGRILRSWSREPY